MQEGICTNDNAEQTKVCWCPQGSLITIYILYIISLLEYCSVVLHSTITDEQFNNLGENKCLQYGLKSLLHPVHCTKFPVNPHVRDNTLGPRNSEHFKVNWAKSESYRMSAIQYIHRMLNQYSVANQLRNK